MKQDTMDKIMILSVLFVTFAFSVWSLYYLFFSSVSLQASIFDFLMVIQGAGH